MRVLVVCDDALRADARLSALERIEMVPVGVSRLARVGLDVRGARPDVLLVDAVASAQEARSALERARTALDRPIGALLLMPADATWLRVPLPLDVRPAVVLASASVDDASLRRGLEQLRTVARVPSGSLSLYGVTLDLRSHEVRANDSRAILTPDEATVLATMLREPSRVVRFEEFAQALYGRSLSDPRTKAAIAQHITALGTRLEPLGVAKQVEGLRGLGYRFVERKGRPRPPR